MTKPEREEKVTPEHRTPQEEHDSYATFFAEMKTFARQMNDLHLQAVGEYRLMVERILRSGSQNQQEIEHTLDRLLDHACVPAGLELYKVLCRYYYPINPVATCDYIQAYRELWDTES
jgi:hypothetical protein